MRTQRQRWDIYQIVKARLAQPGMSERQARTGIEYQGKTFEIDSKTWKRYMTEFDNAQLAPAPAAPAAPAGQVAQVAQAGQVEQVLDGPGKIRFLVGLSPGRLERLKAVAEKKGKPYSTLAAEYIIEALDKA